MNSEILELETNSLIAELIAIITQKFTPPPLTKPSTKNKSTGNIFDLWPKLDISGTALGSKFNYTWQDLTFHFITSVLNLK